MEYSDFIKKGYVNYFEGKKGLYLISPRASTAHQVDMISSLRTDLSAAQKSMSDNLKKGQKLYKVGLSGTKDSSRGIPGRFANFSTTMPLGFVIFAILVKPAADVVQSEKRFFSLLESKGLRYVRKAKGVSSDKENGISEWVGSSLKNLLDVLLDDHKGNTQAWVFDSDDATCKSPKNLAGRKLSTMPLTKKKPVNADAGFSAKKKVFLKTFFIAKSL